MLVRYETYLPFSRTKLNTKSNHNEVIMQTQILGQTGIDVSELCLGTMFFGSKNNKATSYQILDHYVRGYIP